MSREAKVGGGFSRLTALRPREDEWTPCKGALRALASQLREAASPRVPRTSPAANVDAVPPITALGGRWPESEQAARSNEATEAGALQRDRQASATALWVVVDAYRRDGRQFVVAERTEALDRELPTLSPRELQAVRFAAFGISNKAIAYEMAITCSTVGVLLHRAARKLGTHTRTELLERFQEISSPSSVRGALYARGGFL
jgi:DNA-binding CsgD family transcriptional regulator